MRTPLLLSALLLLTASGYAQWEDVQKLGRGGETYVSTDGKGTVYASSHLPVQTFVSRDWGSTWGFPHVLDTMLGDMVILARPGGKAVATVMHPLEVAGMATFKVTNYGQVWEQGKGIPGRPLDREWPAANEKTGHLYMIYSDGYIGGPKSKGVFVSRSTDDGLTWHEMSRVDKSPTGEFAIDPHLVSSGDGKLYALWTTSKDYNTVDKYYTAVSTDGGATWVNQTELAVVNKLPGADVQERWMLGGLASHGNDEVLAFYMDYRAVPVAGKSMNSLLVHTRSSHDGGKTWSEPQTVLSEDETKKAAFNFNKKKVADENFPQYMQCLSWACFDSTGRAHLVWQDNREGQGTVDGKAFGRWQVRHAEAAKNGESFGESEAVSQPVTCLRPPLDFICAAADSKFLYVTWTETPQQTSGWAFTGDFYFGRKKLGN